MVLTQETLKRLLDYSPDTGVFTRLVSTCNRVKVGDIAGYHSQGYMLINVGGKSYLAHRLAWLYTYGYLPEHELDHKDQVGHHNWISNLREVTRSCNMRNTGNRRDNTSGIKGVSLDSSRGKWATHITINGKRIALGRHTDLLEAACHRLAAEQAEGWMGCDSSSPAYKFVQNYLQSEGG